MALKKKDLKKESVYEDTKTTLESAVDESGKVVDAVTGDQFPEAPRSRQGDGVKSGEVPTGYYKK